MAASTSSLSQSLTFGERHYVVAELSEKWQLSEDTIRRIFEKEPGVVIFENPSRSSGRRFRTVRIPESVVARVHARMSVKQ